MLATGTTLGCGLSICLAVFPTKAQATEPQTAPAVYQFDDWTVVVQPAPRVVPQPVNVPGMVIEPRVAKPSHIELTSFQTVPPPPQPAGDDLAVETPVDAVLVNPDNSATATPAPCPVAPSDAAVRAQAYQAIYDSIPFSRAEYEANPSYRHDAAMELLFGQMRPTVINRQGRTRIDVNLPATRPAFPVYNWYGIHNSWSPYMYPPYRW